MALLSKTSCSVISPLPSSPLPDERDGKFLCHCHPSNRGTDFWRSMSCRGRYDTRLFWGRRRIVLYAITGDNGVIVSSHPGKSRAVARRTPCLCRTSSPLRGYEDACKEPL